MIRKIIWFLIFFGMIFLGIGTGIWRNLNNSAYYYATHMPYRKDYYPVARVISFEPLPKAVNKIYFSNLNEAVKEDRSIAKSGAIINENMYEKGDTWIVDNGGITYDRGDSAGMMVYLSSKMKLYDREGMDMKYDR
ncbi:hypothetical protein [Pediococcus claussenii]|uniref:Uncharacterized protein n=1 Tax=Pediococcus claussenii (strain ATCC BAA-344 / DSM 14800 / JCM 18046 / KCTC 3811 / LMG 21948 / P06) TaxID=701521 RepID=G8PAD4_PEDCP|nr:hypothetical protein [Pediococcus claussenii]AEV94573.1 hypothetical protein PECL_250 [Pediococcus claussenii ATCC BAA-344]ANZ69786.1 hypothetical protein AYR57_05390 [Pediococcus claussenii]ANZ71603.1 hypothetical protein AYR58_05395 [Pediococcus claussenii]KRN19721.1 hypothetical protein IV79_GL001008 [Pediococcus claussenii]